MADSIDRVFAHALQTVRKIPRSGSARPPAADRLRLYGLYKQSMEGDVEGVMERPGGWPDPEATAPGTTAEAPSASPELSREEKAEQEKWDAWAACAGLSRSAAKCRYIDTLIATMRQYAYGTPEARELVNELEFVWEQVRGNALSSGNGVEGEIGEGEGSAVRVPKTTTEGLRVLRPMSDQDEEDIEEEGEEIEGERERPVQRPREGTWQARVDKALVQMTAEIAALREVMEARGMRIWGRSRTQGWFRWVFSKIWALVKRAVVDALVITVLYIALTWRKGGRELVLRVYRRLKNKTNERIKQGIGDLLSGG